MKVVGEQRSYSKVLTLPVDLRVALDYQLTQ